MQKFEYASPTTKEQAVALLGKSWGETEVLAGGTDLLSLMKDFIVTPKRLINIKGVAELRAGSGLAGRERAIAQCRPASGPVFDNATQQFKERRAELPQIAGHCRRSGGPQPQQ